MTQKETINSLNAENEHLQDINLRLHQELDEAKNIIKQFIQGIKMNIQFETCKDQQQYTDLVATAKEALKDNEADDLPF